MVCSITTTHLHAFSILCFRDV